MTVRDRISLVIWVFFGLGSIALVVMFGQNIEFRHPGSVVTFNIWVVSWLVAGLLAAITGIYNMGYRHGEIFRNKKREAELGKRYNKPDPR